MRATNILLILIFAFLAISVHSQLSEAEQLAMGCQIAFNLARQAEGLKPLEYDEEMAATLDKKYPPPNCPNSKPADENGYTLILTKDRKNGEKLAKDPSMTHIACGQCGILAFRGPPPTTTTTTTTSAPSNSQGHLTYPILVLAFLVLFYSFD